MWRLDAINRVAGYSATFQPESEFYRRVSLALIQGQEVKDLHPILQVQRAGDVPEVGAAYVSMSQHSHEFRPEGAIGVEPAESREQRVSARLAEVQSGGGQFVVRRVDLSSQVRESARLLKAMVSKATVLHYEVGADLPLVEVDITPLHQVLANLVVNASEALGRGGTGDEETSPSPTTKLSGRGSLKLRS